METNDGRYEVNSKRQEAQKAKEEHKANVALLDRIARLGQESEAAMAAIISAEQRVAAEAAAAAAAAAERECIATEEAAAKAEAERVVAEEATARAEKDRLAEEEATPSRIVATEEVRRIRASWKAILAAEPGSPRGAVSIQMQHKLSEEVAAAGSQLVSTSPSNI